MDIKTNFSFLGCVTLFKKGFVLILGYTAARSPHRKLCLVFVRVRKCCGVPAEETKELVNLRVQETNLWMPLSVL